MYPNSVGYDLYATETVKVFAGSRSVVSLDLRMVIPKGYFGRISPRSGFALNHGIIAFSGTVDSGYIRIVYVLLFNFSSKEFLVEKGNGIAQMIFKKCENVSFSIDENLTFDSERGVKGFRSSGLN